MKKPRFRFFCFTLFLLVSKISSAQLQLDGRSNYDLDGYVFSCIETGSPLNAKEALELFMQNRFIKTPTPDNEFYRPLAQNVYWLAIPVKASEKVQDDLETGIANSGIYHIEYYLTANPQGKILAKYTTGKYYSFFSRWIKCRHYYFPMPLQPGQQAIVLFRLDKRGDGMNAPIRLLKRTYRQQSEFLIYFQYAFFFGLMMFVVIFSMVSFLWVKDRVYLYHSLYVLCCCLFFLADGDLDYEWLYPNWPTWASIASSIYAIGIVFFMLLFMTEFLHLKDSHPKLFKWSRICTLAIATLFILIPAGYILSNSLILRMCIYYYGLFWICCGWFLSIFSIVRRILDHHRPAYLYGFAVTSVVLATLFYILQSLGITIHNFIPFNYLLWAFGVEILILSLAIIYSFNYYKAQHYELSISLANEKLNFGRQLLLSQQTEQQRIARDLHDELGGNLAAIKMALQRFPPDEEKTVLLNYLVDTASDSTRNIAHNLMPPEFENITLPELLEKYLQHLNTNSKTQFQFYCSGTANHFTKQQDLMIYRIALELSNNITKHAKATEATLQFIYTDTHLEIMAEDNGSGFDKTKTNNGMGLNNIKARIDYLNGQMNIDTGHSGTTIIIEIPYQQENEND